MSELVKETDLSSVGSHLKGSNPFVSKLFASTHTRADVLKWLRGQFQVLMVHAARVRVPSSATLFVEVSEWSKEND